MNLSLLQSVIQPLKGLKHVFLARKTVLTIILLNLLVVGMVAVFPQRLGNSVREFEQWQEAHSAWGPLLDRFGLDHIFSTPWFGILLSLTLFTLLLSMSVQFKQAWCRTFTLAAGEGSGSWQSVAVPLEVLQHTLHRAGYRRVAGNARQGRYLKNPWGYWGNPILHGGMVVSIAASLLMALTQQRGLLQLNEGEVHQPGDAWLYSEQGPMASQLIFPEGIGLGYVLPEFWEETGELRRLSSGVRFGDPQRGGESRLVLTLDAITTRHGYRFYQGSGFGHSFALEVGLGGGQQRATIFAIQHPPKRGVAGYGNFHVEGVPYLFKAKYVLDYDNRSFFFGTPTLVLRLADSDKTIGELALTPGGNGTLGPYEVRLNRVGRWSSIVVSRLHGINMIFFGFLLVIVGSGLIYLFPVRELLVSREGEGTLLCWRAGKFALFYREEYETLLHDLQTWNQC